MITKLGKKFAVWFTYCSSAVTAHCATHFSLISPISCRASCSWFMPTRTPSNWLCIADFSMASTDAFLRLTLRLYCSTCHNKLSRKCHMVQANDDMHISDYSQQCNKYSKPANQVSVFAGRNAYKKKQRKHWSHAFTLFWKICTSAKWCSCTSLKA